MSPLKPAFDRARITYPGFSLFWLLFWAIAIDHDRQRREKEQERRKWQAPMPHRVAAAVPRPF